ncbi:MAG: sensor histidine kinase [Trueperaceae bacterium]
MSVRRAAFWAAFGVAGLIVLALGALDLASGLARSTVLARTALGLGGAALLAAGAATFVGRSLTRRLARVTEAADSLSRQPAAFSAIDVEDDEEVARLHRALATMSASMHALLERERSFTRYASHELRTPVGAIKVQLERIDLGAATAADVLPAVARQTARIEELIDALLTLARARDQGGSVRGLRDLVDEALGALAPFDRDRVYLVEPVPDVAVRDAVLVTQALRNLMDNAIRHGAGPVTVGAERDGRALVLRVRDMGPGIPATELRRLADPVGRTTPRPDGHGLGLTLVALIARALDGRLLLHNTEIGLEASLTLDVVADAPG